MVGAQSLVARFKVLMREAGMLGWDPDTLRYIYSLTVTNSVKELTFSEGSWSMQELGEVKDPEGYLLAWVQSHYDGSYDFWIPSDDFWHWD